MSKIPTPARKNLKETNKIIPKRKVICTRRSGVFNKNLQKENMKPSTSKAGMSSTSGISNLQLKMKTRQQVQMNPGISSDQASTSSKVPPIKPGLSSHIVTNSRLVTNRKRPANETNEQNAGAKIMKPTKAPAKIPPYDFKARFNNLKEKYEKLKSDYEGINTEKKDIVKQKEETQNMYETLRNESSRIENELRNVQDLYMSVKEENNSLKYTKQALEDTQNKLLLTTQKLFESEDFRRKLHNDVQDLKGNIRVFCRCRPSNSNEYDKGLVEFSYIDEQTVVVHKQENMKHEFNFNRIYPPRSPQEAVFEDLAQLVQSSLDGYNICVFAYGQTGSGKTYTMIGDSEPDKKGMIPRAVELIFGKIRETEEFIDYDVKLSILEIYNENIKDLLSNNKLNHEIKYNDGKGVTVTNLQYFKITTPREFYSYLHLANKNRAIATTNLNEHSSRSHAVIEIQLKSCNKTSNFQLSSKIYLVDLAGSENAKNSQRMEETKAINKSLSNLGNVMLALQNKSKHVPYRNSKLTYLLQSALGGNSKTLMFVNVSPLEEHFNETLNSMRFASKVMEVKTKSARCAPI